MSNSSILGGTPAPSQADGKDVDLLGPSDSSDSGSDVQGEREMPTSPDNPGEWGALVTGTRNDSDAFGTGERASADGDAPRDSADILPDRVIDAQGLDELIDSAEAADLPDPDDADSDADTDADTSADDALDDQGEAEGQRRGARR